jgi:hypothetical protein
VEIACLDACSTARWIAPTAVRKAKYLDRVGIHYSYTTKWFAGFRTFYHYNLRAHSNGWPMWPVNLHWAGLVVFVMLAVIFIVW